ncbi:thiamine-monophosphate kinase [Skermanella stibiiresistens SB22]|uniref:Thiamine-monophosphate kinase n=1 Tax=Skermanella stibiiresistens SB22 TaxID=1385369 RepID=W9H3A3_9PROT|nr:thiamine-phosphate kinase [Skermanella stibiiresistens]EWY39192.1 thiamine-monophosphate kinase [Skermanella stibiiresistens SB22]
MLPPAPGKSTSAAAPSAGEFGRIDRYLKPLAAGFSGALGLTDDAAVFGIPAGHELVVTTDALVAGVHFLPDDPPADIAAKMLRVNLSDLAAMAAEPLAYSLVTSLPRDIGDDWLAAFATGLAEDQRAYGIHLLGGDSVSTPGPITLSVTAMGLVPTGRALRRGGAGPGDLVFVSGTIGDAALGLRVLQGTLTAEDPDPLIDRYRRPRPRLALVPVLRRFATAGLDVSDGLVADLAHLCDVSGRAAVIDASQVPLSASARAVVGKDPRLLSTVLTGGDDYEIVFTIRPTDRDALLATGAEVTAIGRLEPDGVPGTVTVLDASGAPLKLEAAGWTHFQAGPA